MVTYQFLDDLTDAYLYGSCYLRAETHNFQVRYYVGSTLAVIESYLKTFNITLKGTPYEVDNSPQELLTGMLNKLHQIIPSLQTNLDYFGTTTLLDHLTVYTSEIEKGVAYGQ